MPQYVRLDSGLVARALAVSGDVTRKAAVTRALSDFIARREQKGLIELFGQLEWDPKCDYKARRSTG